VLPLFSTMHGSETNVTFFKKIHALSRGIFAKFGEMATLVTSIFLLNNLINKCSWLLQRLRVFQRPVPQHTLHRRGVYHRHALPHPCAVTWGELQAVEGEKERPKESVGGWGGIERIVM
jgi:hypothetical protein